MCDQCTSTVNKHEIQNDVTYFTLSCAEVQINLWCHKGEHFSPSRLMTTGNSRLFILRQLFYSPFPPKHVKDDKKHHFQAGFLFFYFLLDACKQRAKCAILWRSHRPLVSFSKWVVLEAGVWDGTNGAVIERSRAVAGHCDVSSTFVKPRIAKRMIYRLLKGKKKRCYM